MQGQSRDCAPEAARQRQGREIELGAQILRDLGIVSIRNLVTKPQAYVALSGFGIDISATEIIVACSGLIAAVPPVDGFLSPAAVANRVASVPHELLVGRQREPDKPPPKLFLA